jgi:MFS family permease
MVPRGALALLLDARFGRYFFGKVGSSVGLWIQNIAAAIVVWDLTGSVTLVGMISVAQFIAPVTLAPWTGALTDRFDRRRLLMIGCSTSGLAGLLLSVAAIAGVLDARLIVGASVVVGLGLALSGPAMQALLPALVPSQDLDQAIALNAMVGNLARAIGPAVGTGLLALGGARWAFGVAAAGHLLWTVWLVGLLPVHRRRADTRPRAFDGFRYVGRSRRLRRLMFAVALLGFGIDPILTLTPALADDLGRGETAVGLMASSFGIGAVLVAFLQSGLRRRLSQQSLGGLGFAAMAGGLAVVAVTTTFQVVIVGLAMCGAGFLLATSALTTQIHRLVDDGVRGRVMAVWTMAFVIGRPTAAATNGVIADQFDVRVAVALGVLVSLIAALIARGTRTGREPERREPSDRRTERSDETEEQD